MVRAFLIALLFLIVAIAEAAAEGAVARGDLPGYQHHFIISFNKATRQEANQTALEGCRKKATNCTIIDQFRKTCVAGARSTMGRWELGHGATPNEAKTQATKKCSATHVFCVAVSEAYCDTIVEPVATTASAASTAVARSNAVLLHQSASSKFHRHAEFARLCGGTDYTLSVIWQSPASNCQECNRYTLTCRNGTSHALASWDSPFSTSTDVAVSQAANVGGQLIIVVMFVMALVARFGPDDVGRGLFPLSFAFILYIAIAAANLVYAKYLPDSIWYTLGVLFSYATVAVLALFAFIYVGPFVRGFHYLAVPHPAAARIEPALHLGTPIDGHKLADALTPDLDSLARPPPAYQSRNQAARAEALAAKLQRDTEIAEAAERLARAKAAAADAERELKARKGSSGWRTILTFGRG